MIWLHCVSSSASWFEADMECSMERLLILASPSGLLFTVIGSELQTEPLRWIHQVVPLLWFWPIAVWFFICKWWKNKPANIPLPQLLPHITEIGKKYDSFLHSRIQALKHRTLSPPLGLHSFELASFSSKVHQQLKDLHQLYGSDPKSNRKLFLNFSSIISDDWLL